MKFDLILSNPPFQDVEKRGKTRHKLWIDFTMKSLSEWLRPGGTLCQVSPASFRSPSSPVLEAMRTLQTEWIDFDIRDNFPGIGSTFATYCIKNTTHSGPSQVFTDHGAVAISLDRAVPYLPLDAPRGLEVHRKVMWLPQEKLPVQSDYVTAHNIKRRTTQTVSENQTTQHIYPVFHTNNKTWWSSIEPPCLKRKKVVFTRSGYFRPFFDSGTLGVTDMSYFIFVDGDVEGSNLVHNLNSLLIRYILRTTQWSGFTHEMILQSMPNLPTNVAMSDEDMFSRFGLNAVEVAHVQSIMG